MDVKFSKNYVENSTLAINVKEFLNLVMIRINFFLQKVMDVYPNKVHLVVNELDSTISYNENSIMMELSDDSLIKKYPNLISLFSHSILEHFGLLKLTTIPDDEIEITVETYLKTALYYQYTLAKSLLSIMNHSSAVKFFQGIIDDEIKKERDPKKYLNKLADMNPESEKFQERCRSHDVIEFTINEGRQGVKVLKCKWYEVMKELDDPIMSYAVACHYDFEATKSMSPNFILTRPKTLMMGDDYCDFCYHDTQIVNHVKHPSEEFWKDLK